MLVAIQPFTTARPVRPAMVVGDADASGALRWGTSGFAAGGGQWGDRRALRSPLNLTPLETDTPSMDFRQAAWRRAGLRGGHRSEA